MRKFAITLVLFGALLSACIALLPYAVSTEFFASTVSSQLSDVLDRQTSFSDAKLSLGKTLSLTLHDVNIANPDWAKQESFAEVAKIAGEIPLWSLLRGELHFNKLEIKDLNIYLESSDSGEGSWEDWGQEQESSTVKSEPSSYEAVPETNVLLIENAKVHIRDVKGSPHVPLDITRLELNSVGMSRSGRHSGKIVLGGHPLALDLTHSDLERLLSGRPTPLEVKAEWLEHSAHLKGSATLGGGELKVSGRIQSSGPNLKELEPLLLSELPSPEPYSLSADFTYSAEETSAENLAVKLGESDLAGKFDLDLRTSPPTLRAELNSQQLRMTDLGETRGAGDNDTSSTESSAAGIPYELLSVLAGTLDASIGRWKPIPDLEFDNVELKASLKNSQLQVSKLSGRGLKGRIESSAEIEPGSIALNAAGSDIDIEALRRLLGIRGAMTGQGNIETELTAKGGTPSELLNSLSGNIFAASPGAELENSGLKVLSTGLQDIFSPIFGTRKEVPIECAVLKLNVVNGKFTIDDYVAKLGRLKIFANGSLDSVDKDYSFNFYSRSSIPSVSSLLPPFTVYGELGGRLIAVPHALGMAKDVLDTAEGLSVGTVERVGGGVSSAFNAIFGDSNEQQPEDSIETCLGILEREKKTISSRAGALVQ